MLPIRHSSFVLRHFPLLLLALIPFITLIHKNESGHWDTNRASLAAPDEFSYMLTAQSILHGDGISTQKTLGLDTFYPPGYPLLIAAWSCITGLTPFAVHFLNALLVSAATLIVYLFTKRLLLLLQETPSQKHHLATLSPCHLATIPLLIAGIFATNWHVLESALYIYSEPAFMLVTFVWLALALKWPRWHIHPLQTLAIALLAIAAWSIRGTGIVCIAVTLLYPCLTLFESKIENVGGRKSKIISLALILSLALAYQLALAHYSPEKSLLAPKTSSNSYPQQLLNGITHGGMLHFTHTADWPPIAARVGNLAITHLNDFAESFTPWLRDPPDLLPRYLIGKIFALFALAGFILRLARWRSQPELHFLNLYLILYFILYLLWPFNMARFWSPVLPIMLIYIVDALCYFFLRRPILNAYRTAALLLVLLLLLNLSELFVHLGDYQRRINLVSDCFAGSASSVAQRSPEPPKTIILVPGDDEHFVFAWYFHLLAGGDHFLLKSPQSHLGGSNGPRESFQALLLHSLQQLDRNPDQKLFVITMFGETNFPQIFEDLRKSDPNLINRFAPHLIYRRGWETTTYEFRRAPESP